IAITSPFAPLPASFAAAFSVAASRAQMATRTPSRASVRAIALPMPLLPPVTSAVLPVSSRSTWSPLRSGRDELFGLRRRRWWRRWRRDGRRRDPLDPRAREQIVQRTAIAAQSCHHVAESEREERRRVGDEAQDRRAER